MVFGPQFTVQYRCQYREYWYDDSEHGIWEQAVLRAQQLALNYGRAARVVGSDDSVLFYIPAAA